MGIYVIYCLHKEKYRYHSTSRNLSFFFSIIDVFLGKKCLLLELEQQRFPNFKSVWQFLSTLNMLAHF